MEYTEENLFIKNEYEGNSRFKTFISDNKIIIGLLMGLVLLSGINIILINKFMQLVSGI